MRCARNGANGGLLTCCDEDNTVPRPGLKKGGENMFKKFGVYDIYDIGISGKSFEKYGYNIKIGLTLVRCNDYSERK